MATKRLIDANAMRQDWLLNGENEYVYDTNAVLDSIDSQPTVDAVEVVRCKGCKHCFHDPKILAGLVDGVYVCGIWGRGLAHVKPDDFCSYGERKDND